MSGGETGFARVRDKEREIERERILDELLGIFVGDRFHGLPETFESLETLKQQQRRRRRQQQHQRWQQSGSGGGKVRDGGDR